MAPITITALVLFAVTYILMMAFQKIRPHVTVVSALIFIALGIISAVNPNLFVDGFFTLANGTTYAYGALEALGEID